MEQRTLRTTTILTMGQKWPGLAQGFELVRKRTIKGVTTVEVIYGLTSLKAEEANARRLPGLTRGEGLLECSFSRHEPVAGTPPTRPRSDNNPLNREEYLLHVARRIHA